MNFSQPTHRIRNSIIIPGRKRHSTSTVDKVQTVLRKPKLDLTPLDLEEVRDSPFFTTPIQDENSPLLELPRGACMPRIKRKRPDLNDGRLYSAKRKYSHPKPVKSGDLNVSMNSTHHNIFSPSLNKMFPPNKNTQASVQKRSLMKKDSKNLPPPTPRQKSSSLSSMRGRCLLRTPAPLVNPYSPYVPKTTKKVASDQAKELLQKHFDFYKINKSKVSTRYNSSFEYHRTLNSGSFGTVTLNRCKLTGLLFVVKKIRKSFRSASDFEEANHEVFALSILDKCPYINRYYSSWLEDSLYIQLEFCSGGCVHQLFLRALRDNQKPYPFTEDILCRLTRHLAMALRHMHFHQIVHLDIKPQNIFIRGDNQDLMTADFVLGDFGNARSTDAKFEEVEDGDGQYLAPELLSEKKEIDWKKVDVFGVGVSVYELMLRKKVSSELGTIHSGGALPSMVGYSNSFFVLIKRLLTRHPVGRANVEFILSHEKIEADSDDKDIEIQLLRDRLNTKNSEFLELSKKMKLYERRRQSVSSKTPILTKTPSLNKRTSWLRQTDIRNPL